MSGLDYDQRQEVEELFEKRTGGYVRIIERFGKIEKRVGELETLEDVAKRHDNRIWALWLAVIVPTATSLGALILAWGE